MANKTYNPLSTRPYIIDRFRGVFDPVAKSNMNPAYVGSMANLASFKIGEISQRDGSEYVDESYSSKIHAGAKFVATRGIAEGTSFWCEALPPSTIVPIVDLPNPELPEPPGIEFPPLPPDQDPVVVEIDIEYWEFTGLSNILVELFLFDNEFNQFIKLSDESFVVGAYGNGHVVVKYPDEFSTKSIDDTTIFSQDEYYDTALVDDSQFRWGRFVNGVLVIEYDNSYSSPPYYCPPTQKNSYVSFTANNGAISRLDAEVKPTENEVWPPYDCVNGIYKDSGFFRHDTSSVSFISVSATGELNTEQTYSITALSGLGAYSYESAFMVGDDYLLLEYNVGGTIREVVVSLDGNGTMISQTLLPEGGHPNGKFYIDSGLCVHIGNNRFVGFGYMDDGSDEKGFFLYDLTPTGRSLVGKYVITQSQYDELYPESMIYTNGDVVFTYYDNISDSSILLFLTVSDDSVYAKQALATPFYTVEGGTIPIGSDTILSLVGDSDDGYIAAYRKVEETIRIEI